MKKQLYLLLCIIFCIPLCYAEETGFPVHVGIFENPPFSSSDDNGLVQGLFVDLLSEIGRRENWQVTFVSDSLEENSRKLHSGQIDILAGVAQQEGNSNGVFFPRQVVVSTQGNIYAPASSWYRPFSVLFGSGGRHTIHGFGDLEDKTIATVGESSDSLALMKRCRLLQIHCKLLPVDSPQKAIAVTLNGDADAALLNSVYMGSTQIPPQLENSGLIVNPQNISFAVHGYHAGKLLGALEKYLEQWQSTPDSFLDKSLENWLHPVASVHRHNGDWLLLLLGLAGGAILAVLVLKGMLQKRFQNRFNELQNKIEQLGRSEHKYRSLVESIPYGLQETDATGTILFTNTAEHQIRRYAQGELIGLSIFDLLASTQEREKLEARWRELREKQPEPEPIYSKIMRKDGEIAEIRSEWQYKRDGQGHVTGFYSLITDVSKTAELKEKIRNQQLDLKSVAEQRTSDLLEAYEDLLMAASVYEHTAEGILVISPEGNLQSANPAFLRMSDYSDEELEGQPFALLLSKKHGKGFHDKFWPVLEKQGSWQGEVWAQRKNEQVFPAWITINAVIDGHEKLSHYVALVTDITRRKKAEQQIWKQAHFDSLTGLPNRHLFYQRLKTAIDYGRKNLQTDKTALMFIDLDKFKEVNDTLGHDAGDQLLKNAARRIAACVTEKDTVARMGGDEFTVILPNLESIKTGEDIADKILERLTEEFPLTSAKVHISASIGIVIFPDDGGDLTTLLKNADIAMYRVKESGRNGYVRYRD